MHSGSNNFFAIFLRTGFLSHQETKDSYDIMIVMDGSRIVSPTRDSLGLVLAPHVTSKPDFPLLFSDIMPIMEY